jgi:uncharacterized protein
MDNGNEITDVLTRLIKLMVDRPDEVKIETLFEATGITLQLKVAEHEIGKVIGKQGRTARSLRQILEAIGMTANLKIKLNIVEEISKL